MNIDQERINAYILRLIEESDSTRTAWNLEKIRDGRPADWNYIDGCMITALLEISEITGDERYFDFADRFIGSFVGEDGSVRTFRPEKYNLDDINEGRTLFGLYRRTGKDRYRKAASMLYEHLMTQPRTYEGSFWHKLIYPDQVWLDGIYMAQPFYTLYEREFGEGDYSDIVRQIELVRRHMRDEETGLYYHGYDASKSVFWADPETGRSQNFWLRSIGWYAVALVDILDILSSCGETDTLREIFTDLIRDISAWADPETGMYWQVPNYPAREGNYLETSGSSMIAYACLKGARLGVLPAAYAALGEQTLQGIYDRYLSFGDDGTLSLGGICLVAGLGPATDSRRDGSYEYYISEPVVENDAKGVAPFILAYTEILRM